MDSSENKKVPFFSRKGLAAFFARESTAGLVMIFAMFLALIVENSDFFNIYHKFLNLSFSIGVGPYDLNNPFTVLGFEVTRIGGVLDRPFEWWVNDVFMVFFFLQVGLELKREMLDGFLSDVRQILLPCLAALGGICCPALIYWAINHNHPEYLHGWAIPTATDIAFSLTVLGLVARSIPSAAKILLLAIAIFDDLGAIVIIALFYSQGVSMEALGWATIACLFLWLFNKWNVTYFLPYLLAGLWLWFCFHKGGIHTTMAGVMVAMAYPMHVKQERVSPLNRMLKQIKPWVDFCILPMFAFVSSGLFLRNVSFETYLHPLTIGIVLALFLGKQAGIFAVTCAMLKLKFAKMPKSVTWLDLYGVACVAGIGFTMSLFVGKLALPDPVMQQEIRLGIITGSVLSALWGAVVFHYVEKRKKQKAFVKMPASVAPASAVPTRRASGAVKAKA